jgi:hypothetical protein
MGPIEIRVLEDGTNTDNRIGSIVLKIGPKTKGVGLSFSLVQFQFFPCIPSSFLLYHLSLFLS